MQELLAFRGALGRLQIAEWDPGRAASAEVDAIAWRRPPAEEHRLGGGAPGEREAREREREPARRHEAPDYFRKREG